MKFFDRLSVTGKSVLPVVLLGTLSAIITLYSLLNLRTVDRDYSALLKRDARATMLIDAALLDLSDASRLVFSVLTEQEVARMRVTQERLVQRQAAFRDKIDAIVPLIDEPTPRLANIRQQERQVFALATDITEAATRWRGDRALDIIHSRFDPSLLALREDMDALRDSIASHFQQSSERIGATSRATLRNTAQAFGLALVGLIGLSAWLALTQISRPINQLTQAMSRLSQRDYQHPIGHTARHDELGRMARTLQVFRDDMQRADRLELEITASAEVRRLSQQLVDLTDAMPGALFQLLVRADGAQHFIFLSGKAAGFIGHQRLGPTPSGLLLDEVRVPLPSEALATIEQAIAHSRASLEPLDFDLLVTCDGQRFWLKTLASARRTEDGGTLFNGVWLDVSESKAQASALEQAKEQAEQAARAKSSFLATMSHEIRTPMNAIIGLTQLSLRNPLEQEQRGRLEKILRAGQHLLSIINDILDFSKTDSGHLQIEHIPFTPQQLLDDVQQMLAQRAEEKSLELRIEPAGHLPPLLGDPLRISQILLNYANNALKFSEHGTVHLSLDLRRNAQGPAYLYGEVQDQGIGLSEEQHNHLFQPFQQADSSITRRFGGTGLGLAISRNLAQLLGGEVGVRSQFGVGSTFWFRIPVEVAQPSASAALPEHAPVSPQSLQGLRLLLVDDNELNRLVASELLRELGIQVDQAHDGRHALDLLRLAQDDTYDAVLMDMMMPELDGLRATRLLRSEPRFAQLPVIAMTANASQEDITQCLAAGMNAHVAKPIDEQLLWKALIRHCLAPQDVSELMLPPPPVRPMTPAVDLDPRPLEHLRRLISSERFARMLEMLIEDCERHGELFGAIANGQDSDPATLRQSAHDLIGTAGHAGLKHLGQLGHALHEALRNADQDEVRRQTLAIQQAAHAATAALRRHFTPDMPA